MENQNNQKNLNNKAPDAKITQEVKTAEATAIKTKDLTELEQAEELIIKSAKAINCSVNQFKIALLVLAKLKNYFSDTVRAYKLALNHKEALKAIIDYIVEHKFEKIEDLAATLYCVRKESPKKAVPDEIIKRIATIEITPRKTSTKQMTEIFKVEAKK